MLRLQAESGVTAGVTHVTGGNYTWIWVVAIVGLLALGVAFALVREVLAADQGTSNMRSIAAAVQEGASAYLKRQFRTLGIFAVIVFFLLLLLPADSGSQRIGRSIFFLVGAAFSGICTGTGEHAR